MCMTTFLNFQNCQSNKHNLKTPPFEEEQCIPICTVHCILLLSTTQACLPHLILVIEHEVFIFMGLHCNPAWAYPKTFVE